MGCDGEARSVWITTFTACSRMCELSCEVYVSSGGSTTAGERLEINFFITLRFCWRITILLSANFSISRPTIAAADAPSSVVAIESANRSRTSEII